MIKRLMKNDIDLLKNSIVEKGTVIKSISNVEKFLSNENNYLIAYIENAKILGFVLAYTLQRYDGRGEMLYLHEIDVVETHRKQGIATKLMNEIKELKDKNGFDKIFLVTNKSNEAAVSLYESTGGVASSDDDIIFTFK